MKISIITTSYNSAETIQTTIESVNQQSYEDVEHIFIDGASTDGTLYKIEELSSKKNIIISERDNGIYDALNKGLSLASGDIVGFLHSDDLYAHHGVLATVMACFSDPTLQGVYGDLDYVSRKNPDRVIRRWRSTPFSDSCLKRGWMPPHPTLFVRRSWYNRINGFDTRYAISADYFSIVQLFSAKDFKTKYIPEVLVRMRLGGVSNRSVRTIIRKLREDFDVLKRTGVGGISVVLAKNLGKLHQYF